MKSGAQPVTAATSGAEMTSTVQTTPTMKTSVMMAGAITHHQRRGWEERKRNPRATSPAPRAN
jgi:hypothetical protein